MDGPEWGKRYPLNMRTTRELRDRIQHAAKESGRSLVQEVEYRLEQSFAGDTLLNALHGGDDSAFVLRLIATVMQLESVADDNTIWSRNPAKAQAVLTATQEIIATLTGIRLRSRARYGDAATEHRPTERGRRLAKIVLERAGRGEAFRNFQKMQEGS